jgi:ATP-dependent DNA ligase
VPTHASGFAPTRGVSASSTCPPCRRSSSRPCSPAASPTRRCWLTPRYVAEPKLDGQRAQVHVERRRTVAVYSRPGRELVRLRGLAWLRDVRWPVKAAILDGELFSGEGRDGIDAILAARNGDGADVAFAAFDVLQLDG